MNTKEDCNLLVAANRIRTDDQAADTIGATIAEVLHCKRDREHRDRWQTDWGTKTNIGLARTVLSHLENVGASFLNPKS